MVFFFFLYFDSLVRATLLLFEHWESYIANSGSLGGFFIFFLIIIFSLLLLLFWLK
jgi:hypothetical protein